MISYALTWSANSTGGTCHRTLRRSLRNISQLTLRHPFFIEQPRVQLSCVMRHSMQIAWDVLCSLQNPLLCIGCLTAACGSCILKGSQCICTYLIFTTSAKLHQLKTSVMLPCNFRIQLLLSYQRLLNRQVCWRAAPPVC